jgi:hypothetical protein
MQLSPSGAVAFQDVGMHECTRLEIEGMHMCLGLIFMYTIAIPTMLAYTLQIYHFMFATMRASNLITACMCHIHGLFSGLP